MKKLNLRNIVFIGAFIALQIILTRFLSIQLPNIRIGFQFLPIALCGAMFGGVIGGVSALIGDIAGCLLFSKSAINLGFSISAFLTGFIYGLFLYKNPKSIINVIIAVVLVCLGVELLLNTFWLTSLLGKGFWALLPVRFVKSIVMVCVQTILISFFCKKVLPIIK